MVVDEAWVSSNNAAVSCLTSHSWRSLLRLLEDVQSVPVQSMKVQLELTVAANTLASAWLSKCCEDYSQISATVTDSLKRLINNIDPSMSVSDNMVSILQNLLDLQLFRHLSRDNIESLVDTVSFVILLEFVEDEDTVREYMDWSSRMKVCLQELPACRQESVIKRLDIVNVSGRHADASDTSTGNVVRQMIAVQSGLATPELGGGGGDQDCHVTLLQAATHQRRGNVALLSECVQKLCDVKNRSQQPELVTKLSSLIKGEMLLEENKVSLALSAFKSVIKQDPENIRAYVGIARCFKVQGKFRNELGTWDTICKVFQHIRSKKTEDENTIKSLVDKIVETLFPFESISLVGGHLNHARKLHELEEFKDSAKVYMDTLAITTIDGNFKEDIISILQETLLSLLIIKKHDECKVILQKLLEVTSHHEKRKIQDEMYLYSQILSNFLAGKVSYLCGEYKRALRYFDACLQMCQTPDNAARGRHAKRIRTESGDVHQEGCTEDDGKEVEMVLRLRARLYYEKSLVYRQRGDTRSQSSALKFSLRVKFSDAVYKHYRDSVSEPEEARYRARSRAGAGGWPPLSSSLCLNFIMDLGNIPLLENRAQ